MSSAYRVQACIQHVMAKVSIRHVTEASTKEGVPK